MVLSVVSTKRGQHHGAEDHGAEHHVFYLFIYGAQDLGPEHHGAGKSSPPGADKKFCPFCPTHYLRELANCFH